jgi:4-amino-4-deoxy-L-arabinose transferase-like glycosyltransferase
MTKIKSFLTKITLENKYFWPLTFSTFILARITVWLYPFDSDHWIFYFVGRKFAEGGTKYVSAFDHKPPIIFAFNGLMHLLFGGNLFWHRSLLTLFALIDIYLFWLLLKAFVPKLNLKNPILTARIGFLLYVFLRSTALLANSGNNTENIGLIFFLLLLLLYFKYQEKRNLFLLLIAGICLSFLFLLKGNFILLALPFIFLLAIEKGKTFGRWFLECFLLGVPVLLHFGVWLLYFWQRKAIYDFFVGAFLFSAKYSRVAWSGNLSNNPNLPLSVSIFLLIFIPFLILYFINFKKHQNKYSFLLALYLLTAAVITFGVGPAYPYYFLIALPILVLLVITTMEDIASLPTSFRYSIYFVLNYLQIN